MQRKWKILPLALITALSLTACGGEKTEEVESETDQVEISVDEVEIDHSDLISVSAVELSDEYRSNEPMSDKAFKSKSAEVVGTIHSLNELDGKDYITLLGSETEASPLVHCFFNEDFNKEELNPGDEITIIGTISGKKEIAGDRNNIVIENSILN